MKMMLNLDYEKWNVVKMPNLINSFIIIIIIIILVILYNHQTTGLTSEKLNLYSKQIVVCVSLDWKRGRQRADVLQHFNHNDVEQSNSQLHAHIFKLWEPEQGRCLLSMLLSHQRRTVRRHLCVLKDIFTGWSFH